MSLFDYFFVGFFAGFLMSYVHSIFKSLVRIERLLGQRVVEEDNANWWKRQGDEPDRDSP